MKVLLTDVLTQLLLLLSSVGRVLPQPGPGPAPLWTSRSHPGPDLQPPHLLPRRSRRSRGSSTCRKPRRCGGPHLPATPSCSGDELVTVVSQTDDVTHSWCKPPPDSPERLEMREKKKRRTRVKTEAKSGWMRMVMVMVLMMMRLLFLSGQHQP